LIERINAGATRTGVAHAEQLNLAEQGGEGAASKSAVCIEEFAAGAADA
jgi:hypothetical protein